MTYKSSQPIVFESFEVVKAKETLAYRRTLERHSLGAGCEPALGAVGAVADVQKGP